MCALPFDNAWLKCTLHCESLIVIGGGADPVGYINVGQRLDQPLLHVYATSIIHI